MFTLAHELAHVFYGSSASFDLREMTPTLDRTELACNHVAAEFLVPERQMRQAWPSVRSEEQRFNQLARRFKVSTIVIARRALDLGLINREAFLRFYAALMGAERSKPASKGGDFYNSQTLRIGSRFGSAVVRALREERTTYSEAYSLTGLRGSTFEHYASKVEI
jgi:Zn-dependent peptidase ImmA (M78 family)